jgi:hypothetical protein
VAPAEPQVVPNEERRRSERQLLALPLVVRGVSLDAKTFEEETFTLSVSAHGALVAMATTVTLGQTIFLKNPQTQDEAGAWVTRLASPRSGWTQVAIEFVQPNADFWFNKQYANPPTDIADRWTEGEIHVLPRPEERGVSEAVSADSSVKIPNSQTTSSDNLLHALDQTLRQAAEQAVARAATARLGAAVNQLAETIENFGRARMRQLDERLLQYQQELVTSAHKDFLAEIQADVTRTEEHLRKLAEDFIEDAARKAYGDFAERLREGANQAIEDAKTSSAEHAVRLAEQVQAVTVDARTQIEVTAAGLSESQDRAKGEVERTVAETREIVQSLTSLIKETCAEWERRLRTLQEEFAASKEQEVEHFRERLRSVLTTLLGSLK